MGRAAQYRPEIRTIGRGMSDGEQAGTAMMFPMGRAAVVCHAYSNSMIRLD